MKLIRFMLILLLPLMLLAQDEAEVEADDGLTPVVEDVSADSVSAGTAVNIAEEFDFLPAEGAITVNNRDYAPAVLKLFNEASKTIHIMMLEGGYYEGYPDGANEQLYRALGEAVKRGVEVIVILDQAGHNPSQSLRNLQLGDHLETYGVHVYYDAPEVTTHTKTLIVDSLYTVVGSTNWSYHALDKNNECSVLFKSKELSLFYENVYEELLKESTAEMTVLE